ncbi:hypothetical protein RRG08_028915 [Elysia crispata]|uniref:Uncharacterized protein n=1 Tax=Elysia crispata TaxID=231223 RepID=A0AAE1APR5_9GAST|nr:hypothetical protein RRG08_028915 [Elysia crispata]
MRLQPYTNITGYRLERVNKCAGCRTLTSLATDWKESTTARAQILASTRDFAQRLEQRLVSVIRSAGALLRKEITLFTTALSLFLDLPGLVIGESSLFLCRIGKNLVISALYIVNLGLTAAKTGWAVIPDGIGLTT